MPANLHQVSRFGIAPKEAQLANFQGQVGALVLPQHGSSELAVSLSM